MLACPARQHEAVAVGPVRVGRGVAQEARPEHVGHRRRAHRRARMTGVRLLDAIDGERADGVDGELVEVGGEGHAFDSVGRCRWQGGNDIVGPGPAILPGCRRSGVRVEPRHRSVVVLGDLVLDVVLATSRPLQASSDVPGAVSFVQGGSAANTARWVARLGARSILIAAVGRDATGRALVEAVRVGRGGRPCLADRRRPDWAHRRAGGTQWRTELRPGSRGRRAARTRRAAGGLVRGRRRPSPAGLFAARAHGQRPVVERSSMAGPPARPSASTWLRSGRSCPAAAGRPARCIDRGRRRTSSLPPPRRPRHCSGWSRWRISSGSPRSRP